MVAYDFGVGQFFSGSMGQLYPGDDKYTSDNFYDINWHWNWYENSIRNLIALCPKCHYQMTQEVKGYYCDKCGKKIANQYNPSNAEMESIVERMIHQRVRTKEYIEIVNRIKNMS